MKLLALLTFIFASISSHSSEFATYDSFFREINERDLGVSCVMFLSGKKNPGENSIEIKLHCGQQQMTSPSLKLTGDAIHEPFAIMIDILTQKGFTNTSCTSLTDTQSFLGTGINRMYIHNCVFQKF